MTRVWREDLTGKSFGRLVVLAQGPHLGERAREDAMRDIVEDYL